MEKKSKNLIQWKNSKCDFRSSIAVNSNKAAIESQIETMRKFESDLDNSIAFAENSLKKLALEDKLLAYINYQDLRGIREYKDKTVMAVKAPPESELLVSPFYFFVSN